MIVILAPWTCERPVGGFELTINVFLSIFSQITWKLGILFCPLPKPSWSSLTAKLGDTWIGFFSLYQPLFYISFLCSLFFPLFFHFMFALWALNQSQREAWVCRSQQGWRDQTLSLTVWRVKLGAKFSRPTPLKTCTHNLISNIYTIIRVWWP